MEGTVATARAGAAEEGRLALLSAIQRIFRALPQGVCGASECGGVNEVRS